MITSSTDYKLAVIIPNYNGENKINRMLDCILEQNCDNWKVFIVDDISSDRSDGIINEYVKKDNRFFLYKRDREPKGAQTCRNIGFELSQGAEYIMFFDNDDSIAYYCFKQRIEFMDEHPELDFGVFPAKTYSESFNDKKNGAYGCKYIDDSLNAMLNWTLPMVGWTNIYRRDSYIRKGLNWDINLLSMQDSDFNIQAILKGCRFEYAYSISDVKPDYFYYTPPGRNSTSSKIRTIDHFNSNIYLITKIINSLSDYQKDKYKIDILSYILQFVLIMGKHKPSVCHLLTNRWIKAQTFFWLKLYLWNLLGRKYKLLYKLYCPYFSYYNERQRKWKAFMKEKAEAFRQVL